MTEVSANASRLQSQYLLVVEEFNEATPHPSTITSLLASATASLDGAELAVINSRESIDSSRSILSELSSRLDGLEVVIEGNVQDLERAKTFTSMATNISLQIKSVRT